jgi:membrane associated rhomboid family serine protease
LQLLYDLLTPAGTPGIAFRAHLAGFVAGIVITPFFAWNNLLPYRRLLFAKRAIVRTDR